MTKTILITGATDGIGLETAKRLAAAGHRVLMHGRNAQKLNAARQAAGGETAGFLADLSDMDATRALADAVARDHSHLDVLINNAGILKTGTPRTPAGLDIRFAVNTLAPYLLTTRLLPLMPPAGRVVNLSSAAQAPVDLAALAGQSRLSDMEAYAQSKLAITMWTRVLAAQHPQGPVIVAVNPGSLLATKMVREGFGMAGKDLSTGADILCRAALSDEFAEASAVYFDNDAGRFAAPHPDAADMDKARAVTARIAALLTRPAAP